MNIQDFQIYALSANFCFALATIIFTHFTNKVSSEWMNLCKAFVAFLCFFIYINIFENWYEIDLKSFAYFFVSGFIGLGIGDFFLLKSFSVLGPGRTLMLFGFQPIFLGVMGKMLFNQDVSTSKLIAIIFFIGCLFTLSLESFRKDKSWGVVGMSFALLGMILDSSGVLMTRASFDMNPGMSAMQGNFYRCLGAISVFMLLSFYKPLNFMTSFNKFTSKEKAMVIGGSILGTFLSLSFYLKAIQTAHLASLSGINITGTLFSSAFESVFLKKKPTKYLFIALIFFAFGMYFLIG